MCLIELNNDFMKSFEEYFMQDLDNIKRVCRNKKGLCSIFEIFNEESFLKYINNDNLYFNLKYVNDKKRTIDLYTAFLKTKIFNRFLNSTLKKLQSYIKSLKNTTLSMKKEIQKPESNKVVENVENFKNKDNKANDNGNDDFDMDFLNNSGIMDDLFNNDNDKDIGNGNGNGININTNNNQYQSNNNTFNNTFHNNNKSLLDKSFDSNLNNSNSYNNQQNTKKNNNNLYKNNSDLEVQSSKINNKTKNQVRIVL